MAAEFDFRANDSYLSMGMTAATTTMVLGHSTGFPSVTFWATIAPASGNEREEVLVTARSGNTCTVLRGFSYAAAQDHKHGTVVTLGTRSGATGEPWNAVSSFTNSWANLGAGTAAAAYRLFPDGLVTLRGTIDPGTVGSSAFNLPVAYRQSGGTLVFPAAADGAYGEIQVGINGNVTPTVCAGAWISLDGVRWSIQA